MTYRRATIRCLLRGSVALVGFALASCGVLPEEPAPIVAWSATVYGRITDPEGQPVLNARVSTAADQAGNCPAHTAAYVNFPFSTVSTDAAGAYSDFVATDRENLSTCVRVIVTPPIGSGLERASVSTGPVRLRYSSGDSLRVDLVLLRALP